MAKLADLLAAGEVQPPRWLIIDAKEINAWRESIARAITASRRLVVDRMAALYFAAGGSARWEIGQDFANLAPLEPTCWLESRRPASAATPARAADDLPLPEAWGWLIESHDIGHLAGKRREVTPAEVEDVRRSLQASLAVYGDEIERVLAAHGENARQHLPPRLWHYFDMREELADVDAGRPIYYPADQKWEVRATLFEQAARRVARGPLFRLDLLLGEQGNALKYVGGPVYSLGAPEQPPRGSEEWGFELAKLMLLALALRHCQGVELSERSPAAKLVRAHERRHGHPLLSYDEMSLVGAAKPLTSDEVIDSMAIKRILENC